MQTEWKYKGTKYGVAECDEVDGKWYVSIWWKPPGHTEQERALLPGYSDTEEEAVKAAENYIRKVV